MQRRGLIRGVAAHSREIISVCGSTSASLIAPSSPMSFLFRLPRAGGVVSCAIAGTSTAPFDLRGGSALEPLEHSIVLDAARDDDHRRCAKVLVPKLDRLGRLAAPERVDWQRTTIDPGVQR